MRDGPESRNGSLCAGSIPVLTTEGANPETRNDKVGDSLERRANSQEDRIVFNSGSWDAGNGRQRDSNSGSIPVLTAKMRA